jgi:hypothetical protein
MAEKKVLIENKPVALTDTKVQFGAVNAPTPQWVKIIINITTILTTAVVLFIAGTNIISEPNKYEAMLGIKALDVFVIGVGKMFGVVEK